jgi:hypothetical protein
MSVGTDYEIRKQMFDEIKKFNKTEQEELYRILRRCDEDLSENKNGIFFDLMNLRQTTIKEIQDWISFCNHNRTTLETREKEMSQLESEMTAIGTE